MYLASDGTASGVSTANDLHCTGESLGATGRHFARSRIAPKKPSVPWTCVESRR